MRTVLDPPSPSGTVVLDKSSNGIIGGESVRLEDAGLPAVGHAELPLPLSDSRRVYRSAVPGVKLTHPGGPLEGGAPPFQPSGAPGIEGQIADDIRDFARQLVKENSLKNPTQLKKFISAETQRQIEELKRQMSDRSRAKEQNEQTQKEINKKDQTRALERKIEERFKKDAAARRDS